MEWLVESGVKAFKPKWSAYRCEDFHECIALAEIEVPLRNSAYPHDANGFRHDRMVRILTGIRDDVALPAIYIERAGSDQRTYRLRLAFLIYRRKSSNASIE
jgi:hypothetical protein